MILESALLCLALNIYHEARGESVATQEAVASVTFNRAKQNQENVCNVVFEPKQFSWTNRLGNVDIKHPNKLVHKLIKNTESKEWKTSIMVARKTLLKELPHYYNGATHFYNAKTDNPRWKNHFLFLAKAGPFILMKQKS